VGYEGPSKKDEGLKSLEMELAYLGGTCAASLMKKNIPLTNQNGEDIEEDMDIVEDSAAEAFEMHSSLLSKGFALERPPNVQQALDGVIPFSCNSNERLFLRNFVHCAPGTSGGRLARWLQPESFVDVDQCEVLFNQDDMKCNWPTIITIITHDQYGDVVQVPNLRVRQA
jgi:E3 ubiquitin-protein ligase MYCBP2